MNTTQKEPMVKNTNQVLTTVDYFLFKPINGNRNKNLLHINRLRESMSQNYLFTIITVNEKYEIIDGQHRFEVIEELKLPLHYVVCKGYGLKEVHILNQNSKTWNADDYLTGYCNLGYKEYLLYKQFKDKFGFGHIECMCLLTNSVVKKTDDFYSGKFKIKSYTEATKIANQILLVAPLYEGYRRRTFIYAILQLMKNKHFDFDEFLQKLKQQPTALVDCVNTNQYVEVIEKIYNHRRRERVSLRY